MTSHEAATTGVPLLGRISQAFTPHYHTLFKIKISPLLQDLSFNQIVIYVLFASTSK